MKVLLINLLIIHPDQKRILCVKRSEEDKIFAGMWVLPGGKNENGENILETSKRELYEETGLKLLNVSSEPILQTLFVLDNYEVDLHIYKANVGKGNIKPIDKDIEKAEWISPRMLLKSLKKNNYPEEEISKLKQMFIKEKLI